MLLVTAMAHAQVDTLWVPYEVTRSLRDGIHLTFQEFKNDAPSISWQELKDEQGLPVTTLMPGQRLSAMTSDGTRRTIDTDRIWGYCLNGAVHLRRGMGFNKIGMMGSAAHVLVEEQRREWDPYLYGGMPRTYTVEAQFLLDMVTGDLHPLSAAGLDAILAHDPLLQEEFRSLDKRRRQKPETLFLFIRLYNERNPLLFPRPSTP